MVQATPRHNPGPGNTPNRRPSIWGGGGELAACQAIHVQHGAEFIAGVQTLAPSISGAGRQGGNNKNGGGNDVGGMAYSENNVAALKKYCGVANPAGIPTIWDAFQQMRKITPHWHNLQVTMSKWAKDTGKDINKAPFSPNKW